MRVFLLAVVLAGYTGCMTACEQAAWEATHGVEPAWTRMNVDCVRARDGIAVGMSSAHVSYGSGQSSQAVDIGAYPIRPNVFGPGIGMDSYGRAVVAVPY